jgi:succinyl-diaminopimelate desuccinylase
VWLDVRTIPGIEHGVLLADLRELARESGAGIGITTEIELIDDRPVVEVSPDDPLVRAVWDAHAGVLGETPRLGGVPGATDGTVLTSRTGIPSLVYGPGGKFIAHQADEFVEVADIARHAEVYVDAAQRFFAAAQV